ncbi:MAG TPA: DUF2934 domain-containing protein [Verrucomicrobiae bacterium]|nr:DUF2934 domain-containing protein [Verrucomicrobiae bacterium]
MKLNRPTEEQIRERAREIFLEHGGQPGHDVDNWLQAEYELMQLPVRKLVELDPPKAKPGNVAKALSLVGFVHLITKALTHHLKR